MLTDRYLVHLTPDALCRLAPDHPEVERYLIERMREAAPAYPAHGEQVGEIIFRLHGHEAIAELLSTGKHCRSYGVRIGGRVVGVMGADRAWSEYVSPAVPRMMSIRRLG